MSEDSSNERGASYESTGAAGTDYEVDVAAGLLARVLAAAGDRALPPGTLADVATLQRREGPPGFDDLTVHARQADGVVRPVYIQARRTFSFTAGESFTALARAIFDKDQEDESAEWTAAIVTGRVRPDARDVFALSEAARAAISAEDFEARWRPAGVLNVGRRALLEALDNALDPEHAGRRWRVLRRLVLVVADYDQPTSADRRALIDLLRDQLDDGSETEAVEMLDELRSLVLRESRLSASYARSDLTARLHGRFSLTTSRAARGPLEAVLVEGRQALEKINAEVGGLQLLRPELQSRADEALRNQRVLRLVGEGGAGKSAVLKRVVRRRGLRRSLVLKEDRVAGRTWREYAEAQGFPASARVVVDELAAGGKCLLAIDGADRLLLTHRRGVVLDLLRAIAESQLGDAWLIITSARDLQDRDLVRDALQEAGLAAGLRLRVGPIGGEDARWLSEAHPQLKPILLREDVSERNRDLFTIRELLLLPSPEAAVTEVDLAALWASRGARAPAPDLPRDAAVAQLGEVLTKGGRSASSAEIDPSGAASLLQEPAVRSDLRRDAMVFAHDVYEDWALSRALDRRRGELPTTLLGADQPLWWLRAVRLAGQIALEEDGGANAWRDMVQACAANPDLDPVWVRTLFVAPLYSERYHSLLDDLEPVLLAEDGRLLEQLLDTLLVFETELDEDILASDALDGYSDDERRRLAAASRTPKGASWRSFLQWSASRWETWPTRLIPKLADVALIWQRATEGWPNRISRRLATTAVTWLTEIEDARHTERWEDRRPPFGHEPFRHRELEEVVRTLRRSLAFAGASGGGTIPAYLRRVAEARRLQGAADQLIQFPRALPQLYPAEYADLAIRFFTPPRRRRPRGDFLIPIEPFSLMDAHEAGIRHNAGFFPSAPDRAGFSLLLSADEEQALRLLRRLEKRAAVTWRWMSRYEGRRPRPVVLRTPWGEVPLWGDENVYRWGRGILGPNVLGSMYLALDDWMQAQAEAGRPLEEIFRLVLRPHGLVATLVPCINALVARINSPGQIDAAGPILGEPRLWSYEVRRFTDDLSHATRPLGFMYWHDPHRAAVVRIGERYAGRQHLRNDLVLPFHVLAGEPARSTFYARVDTWTAADLASYEDEIANPAVMAEYETQLERYKVDADPSHIEVVESGEPGQLAVSIRPPDSVAERIQEITSQHEQFNSLGGLWVWAVRSLEAGAIQPGRDLGEALPAARAVDREDLFVETAVDNIFSHTAAQAVAGVAAIAAVLGDDATLEAELPWVRDALNRASRTTRAEDALYVDAVALAADPQVFAARGLAALVSRGRGDASATEALLTMAVNRHHAVSTAVVEGLDARAQPLLAWTLFRCVADLCLFDWDAAWRGDHAAKAADRRRRQTRTLQRARKDLARSRYRSPEHPPRSFRRKIIFQGRWPRPVVLANLPAGTSYDWSRGKALLDGLPLRDLVESASAAVPLLMVYLEGLADWTRAYSETSQGRWGQDHYPFEFATAVAKMLGRLAWLIRDRPEGADLWASLRRFQERDRAFELTGDFLEGLVEELVGSGTAPDDAFWTVRNSAARWVMNRPENSARAGRDTDHPVENPVAAVGFVGPFFSPLPPDWPHLGCVLPAIDDWAGQAEGSASATNMLFRFAERFGAEEVERHVLPWVERRVERHRNSSEFWDYGDNGDRAALLLRRVSPAPTGVRRRLRVVLGVIADAGSLAAREQIVQLSARS